MLRAMQCCCAAILLAAAPSVVQAQQSAPGTTKPAPKELIVAPDAAQNVPNMPTQSRNSPAEICGELDQFLKSEAAKAKPAQSQSAEQKSGETQAGDGGNAAEGPRESRAPSVDKSQKESGITNPVPNADARNDGVSPEDHAKAAQIAAGGDPRQCQATVREMRRAGVAMPAALLALGALKSELVR